MERLPLHLTLFRGSQLMNKPGDQHAYNAKTTLMIRARTRPNPTLMLAPLPLSGVVSSALLKVALERPFELLPDRVLPSYDSTEFTGFAVVL